VLQSQFGNSKAKPNPPTKFGKKKIEFENLNLTLQRPTELKRSPEVIKMLADS
jgi:hypothetical protein